MNTREELTQVRHKLEVAKVRHTKAEHDQSIAEEAREFAHFSTTILRPKRGAHLGAEGCPIENRQTHNR